MEDHAVWRGAAAGLLGGLAASWAMNKFQNLLDGQSSEDEAVTAKIAEAGSQRLLGHALTHAGKKIAAPVVHYAIGGASGAAYGALAEVLPAAASGAGALFGAMLWITADEVMGPALGFAKRPAEYPISTHGKALAAHLVYGVATELVRRALVEVI